MSASLSHVVLVFCAGIGIPIMAALNSHLGGQIGTAKATVILFALAMCISVVFLCLQPQGANKNWQGFFPDHVENYFYLGGTLVAFYVLSITYVAPIMGVANAIVLVLFGQIISSVLIDHFALFNAAMVKLTPERVLGIILMCSGIYLARKS